MHAYFEISRTKRTSCLRNLPPTSWGRIGTVSTPTARPSEVSGFRALHRAQVMLGGFQLLRR